MQSLKRSIASRLKSSGLVVLAIGLLADDGLLIWLDDVRDSDRAKVLIGTLLETGSLPVSITLTQERAL